MPGLRNSRFPGVRWALSFGCVGELRTTGRAEDREEGLGGRLALLPVAALQGDQAELHQRLMATRVEAARSAGYEAALPDGRLTGPFNAFLRAPVVADAQLDWIQAIDGAGTAAPVREAVILTVGAQWGADYVLYAHSRGAAAAGLAPDAVTALCQGRTPDELEPTVLLAHRLALALVRDHEVPDQLYADALASFGDEGLVVLLALIGQYQATAAVLVCFQVPAPGPIGRPPRAAD